MAVTVSPSRLEGSLLDPRITPAEVRRRLGAWAALGIGRVVAPPNLLGTLRGEARGSAVLAGTVGHPTGSHTLATKRMEALECIRLGVDSLLVALDPAALAAGDAGAIEGEMAALRKTAEEAEVGFSVPWDLLAGAPREIFLRVLRAVRPPLLVLCGGSGGGPSVAELRTLCGSLPRKVRFGFAPSGPAGPTPRDSLDAGCAFVRSETPESLLGVAG